MNQKLSKNELLIITLALPLVIYYTRDIERSDIVVTFILLAAVAATINFAIPLLRWWVDR
ncbi:MULTISPECIES: hypothetical protein [Methylomonas]|uniref:Uncharacterized protein n=2 Tax=Methylomonas TaxID=416 RepID=A0A140E6N7_9GAMM|nr:MULTISPECIES: hypothetical protein [Methylomonas]AMK79061.1 hypothetical protein JT25_021680 [Methylomonas denitrificans]OAI08041.1 hypothetical protein A1342_10860 [Methylomonas methanica]TCV79145.1 hypothetical protein EDE11_12118 [Methylomonas methanica]